MERKEAIEVIKKNWPDSSFTMLREALETLIPELKESEDEGIRKELIAFVKSRLAGFPECDRFIGWIEKQGKQKSVDDLTQQEAMDIAVAKCFEQGEQKPADKVEPKFHEGEWLCENEPNNYARFIQILEIVNVHGKERYRISRDIHNDEDIVEFDFVEKYYHKFDIQDAKTGDVLVHNCCTFIFMGVKNGIVQAIEKYLSDGTNPVCFGEPNKVNDYHPATKEQRDTLMKAIADAGYTFDFENKELKKVEQKPAWNEEDSMHLTNAIYAVEKEWGIESRTSKWLKSLKDRVGCEADCTTTKEWSAGDK